MDKRVLRTRRAIFDAVVDISAEKKLEDVKVIELCEKAQINKSTFYLHFTSLEDCFQQAAKVYLDGVLSLLDDFNYNELAISPEKTIAMILDIAEQYASFISRFKSSLIFDNAINYTKNAVYQRICESMGISEETNYAIAIRTTFLLSGIIDVIIKHIDNLQKEELCEAISDIIKASSNKVDL